LLNRALMHLEAARPKAAARGRYELAYLINRTESYRDAMHAYITMHEALVAFDRAFADRNHLSHEKFVAALEASLQQCGEAHRQIQAVTAKFAQIIDHPADLEILYHLNVRALMAFDLTGQWLRQVVNFQEGKPYTQHVPFERLFPLSLRLGRALQDQM